MVALQRKRRDDAGKGERCMKSLRCAVLAVGLASLCAAIDGVAAQPQQNPAANAPTAQGSANPSDLRRLALKSGENVELGTVYYVANCRSIMIGKPEVEVLEGPPEVKLIIKEGDVVPRRAGCSGKVPGGTLVLAVSEIKETKIARLIYRVKYQTKDGDRQAANAYYLGLVP
jgi:hypothetical protein